MTQLVQLQQVRPALLAAGYEVFAISNDTVDRLAVFATQHAVTFPLLSDEDSAVIRAFGIMNTLVQPGEGAHMRWYGIPYPGTYIVDADGVVVDKDFHQHHARRLSGPALLHRVLGTVPGVLPDAPQTAAAGQEVTLTVHLSDPVLRLEVLSTLVCRLDVAPGLHLYADGAPEAFTPAALRLDGDGLRFGPARWPGPTSSTCRCSACPFRCTRAPSPSRCRSPSRPSSSASVTASTRRPSTSSSTAPTRPATRPPVGSPRRSRRR